MTSNPPLTHRLLKGDLSLIFYFSMVRLILQLTINATGGYGLFRDELYYIACSQNLAAGYVDHPPLCAWVLRVMTELFGDSLFVVRFLAALAGGLTVFLTGLITLRLGGGRLATFISCALSFSAINLVMASFYSMNAFDILFWTAGAYIMVRIIQDEKKEWWIVLGVVLGFGLLNKIGVLFLGAGIFVGMVATDQRKWFKSPFPYIAGVIALLLFVPFIIWNMQNSFAHLEFIRNATTEKYSSQSAGVFLAGQILLNNPVAFLVWFPGLIALFTWSYLSRYRILGWMYLLPLLIFIINGNSKPEYLAPAYGMLFAAGAVFWERLIQRAFAWRVALATILGLWAILTLIGLPLILPVLSVENYIKYSAGIGFKPPSSEGKEQSELPQFYADMFGWKEKAKGVAAVYNNLSPEEKSKCAIFSDNYGRCASIDYYGRDLGLPKTIGNHNNYWIWGTRGYTGEVMIILGGDLEDHQPNFREVKFAAVIDCQYCMPYEDNVPVFLCRDMKGNLNSIWPEEKHFE
jgi:hypothetical protein